MVLELINATGIWTWWIAGVLLLGIEVLAPGTFFLWFGLAAFVVGALTMAFGLESTMWTWQVQILTFVVLAALFAFAGRRMMEGRNAAASDRPDINERGAQLVGKMATVSQAIAGGTGRVRIGDTTWRASGPSLPEGAQVRVVSAEAATLTVEPVE